MRRIRSQIEVLSPDEIQLIHDSSAEILETMGIGAPHRPFLDRMQAVGCEVDDSGEILRIPRRLLEDTLQAIKQRNAESFLREQEDNTISAHISTQVRMVDYRTRTYRYGLRDDNRKALALVEQLEHFPSSNAITVPSDVPYEISDLICYEDIYKYSTKPGGTYVLTPLSAKYILQLNRLMNRESRYLLETISPLSFKQDTLEMALLFADNGGRLDIGPMAMSSATAPATLAGTVTLENAEVIASMFISFLLTGLVPGYSAPVHSMDPQTMLCSFGSPNQALFGVAHSQMARFYGVHSMSNAGLTDALLPDFQGGFEKGVTAAFNYLSGARGMGAQGIVGADQGNCLEQLVLDNEWIAYYNYVTRGFEVSASTIGLEVLQEVGQRGNFIAEEHTVEYLRESYLNQRIFLRDSWDNWTGAGQPELLERAHAFVQDATAGYEERQPVLSPSLCEEIDRIVETAVEEVQK